MKAKKTCGSCLFFDKEIPPGERKNHKDAGHKEYGKPCGMYEPNPFPLADKVDMDYLRILARIVNDLGPTHLDNLAHTILGIKRIQQNGFRFMQRVYYRWRGPEGRNYINNWLSAFVAGISRDGRELRLYSYDGSMGLSVPTASVLLYPQWKTLFQEMRDANKVYDPNYKHMDFPAGEIPSNAATSVRNLEEVNWTGSKAENGKPYSPKSSMVKLFNNIWEKRDEGYVDEIEGGSVRKRVKGGKLGPSSFSVTGSNVQTKPKQTSGGEKKSGKGSASKKKRRIDVKLVETPIDKVLGGILDI